MVENETFVIFVYTVTINWVSTKARNVRNVPIEYTFCFIVILINV